MKKTTQRVFLETYPGSELSAITKENLGSFLC